MKKIAFALISASVLYACSDEIPMVNLGIDDVYYIPRMQKLDLHPALTGEKYEWYVDGILVSTSKDYIFLASDEGSYTLELKILDPNTPYDFEFTIHPGCCGGRSGRSP